MKEDVRPRPTAGTERMFSDVDSPAGYLDWWFVQLSIPNLLLIVGMVVVFLLALVAPFPHPTDEIGPESPSD